MVRIKELDVEWIIEDSFGFIERDAMFRRIRLGFLVIPLKFHEHRIALTEVLRI